MDVPKTPPPKRLRRTPEALRAAALGAARELLIAQGPSAVTLKAVAARAKTGHANLLHHFGSAADLQAALMDMIVRATVARVEAAVALMRSGQAAPRDLVDLLFDAFSSEGIGQLTAWLVSTGETQRLTPLFSVVTELLQTIEAGAALPPAEAHRRIADITLIISLTGLGDALIGPILHQTTGQRQDRARALVADMLAAMIGPGGLPPAELKERGSALESDGPGV